MIKQQIYQKYRVYSNVYPNNFKNWILAKRKLPAIQRSKTTQYYNMGSFLIVESRGFLKAKNPIFEVVWVYA